MPPDVGGWRPGLGAAPARQRQVPHHMWAAPGCARAWTGEPPAGPHLGSRSTMGQPKAQGQRSIQIDGFFACAMRIAPNSRRPARSDLYFGAGDKQGRSTASPLPLNRFDIVGVSQVSLDIGLAQGTDHQAPSRGPLYLAQVIRYLLRQPVI